jgi:hypothetical protein
MTAPRREKPNQRHAARSNTCDGAHSTRSHPDTPAILHVIPSAASAHAAEALFPSGLLSLDTHLFRV